jgi:PAS domain S-box-containing protein
LEGKNLQCNWALAKLLGYDSPNDVTNTVTDSGHQVWLNADERLKYTALLEKSDVVRGYECQFKRLDGKVIWVSLNGRLVRDENRKKLYYEGFLSDITERKITEEMLRNSEKQYRLLFDESLSGFAVHEIICDQSGKPMDYRFLSVNKVFERITGLDASDILGKTVLEVLPETEYSWIERYGKVALTGEPIHFENYAAALGKHYEVHAYCPENGKFATIINDITERKQIEQKLLGKDALLNITGHTAKVGGWEIDTETMKQKWTDEVYAIHEVDFTFNPNVNNGINYYAPLSRPVIEKAVQQAIEFGEPFDLELELITNKGNHRWVHSIGEVQQINGKTKNVYGSIQDITDRKKAEIDLIKAKEKAEESDRLKSAFLTNMSHEIRTPMNGILGFAELLKEPNLSSDDQQDYIQTIGISGARMLNTINSIVDMSKIESGLMNLDIKETNINEKIEFTYKFFKPEVETKGLKFLFKNSLQAKEAIIKTDNEKVYAILTNLVRNAIKFTYEGSIEFGYDLVKTQDDASLQFFVKDTGVGIPQNQCELIFERFRQGSESNNRGYEGSGLGLSICKSYVEMLGGRIWVESQEGRGSIFYFTIPYNPVSEETQTIENVVFTENKEVQVRKLKILIVEDDEISYSLLRRTLQNISKEVLHSITGVEAVEACRNNPDIDLVLMDIRMPKMDGNEATRQIRKSNTDVIIIAQTAYGFAGDREKAIEAGSNDYIAKPINHALLIGLILKYFNK